MGATPRGQERPIRATQPGDGGFMAPWLCPVSGPLCLPPSPGTPLAWPCAGRAKPGQPDLQRWFATALVWHKSAAQAQCQVSRSSLDYEDAFKGHSYPKLKGCDSGASLLVTTLEFPSRGVKNFSLFRGFSGRAQNKPVLPGIWWIGGCLLSAPLQVCCTFSASPD